MTTLIPNADEGAGSDDLGGLVDLAGGGAAATCVETNCAVVFLVGELAVKLKKPVDVGFGDFTTPAARRRACQREVELNRRLAPDVYLGVLDVRGPDGNCWESLVAMRRMPAETRLSTLVTGGGSARAPVRALARRLAGFHSAARSSAEITAAGGRDALRQRWEANLAAIRPLGGPVLDVRELAELARLASRYLAGREPLFAARMAAGLIRDGHGDLTAEDVFCLPDGPRVLDCLEFDDRLRFLDGLDDVASLALDLERLGAGELARGLLDDYHQFTGTRRVVSLEHHYLAYRAVVRAMVEGVRYRQGVEGTAEAIRSLAGRALVHLRRGATRLVLLGGSPGTGKSTLAGALADRLGWVLLGSDRVRGELVGQSAEDGAGAALRSARYRPEWTERTYTELLARSGELLALGESVVLDATWGSARQRSRARAVAERTSADLVELRCWAPPHMVAARLRARAGTGDPSDADELIAAALDRAADPWPEAIAVNTAGSPADALGRALAAVRAGAASPT